MRCGGTPHDTEDRSWWYKYGELGEAYFVEWVCPDLELDGKINPDKEKNPTAPDLIVNGKLSDLKTQKTPFFTAARHHKTVDGLEIPFDPTYTVTFNVKDFIRYGRKYPDIDLYFWVQWAETSYSSSISSIKVDPISGVWVTSFKHLKSIIEDYKYPVHNYLRRYGRLDNAVGSYLVDLRDLEELSCRIVK